MDQAKENDKKVDSHIESELRRDDLLDETVAPSWAKKHIVSPFVHSAFYEPAAIIIGKSFKDAKPSTASYLNKKESSVPSLSVEGAQTATESNLAETMVEIVAGAAGAGLVYAIAGKASGALFRAGAQRGLLGNTLPKYVATENGSMVAGAAMYDTARHPNQGETRLGNAVAGAASFAVFIKGNALTAELNTGLRIASLPVIGAVGGLVQKQVSVGIAQERLINGSEFGEAVLAGAVINTVLPGATKAISMGIDHYNIKSGRGVPVERVAKEKGWLSKSNELDALIYANPYARVRFDASAPNSLNSRTATISLNIESPSKLGHELKHLELRKQGEFSQPYDAASKSLGLGNKLQAEQQFLKARETEEGKAIRTENEIASDMGLTAATNQISTAQRQVWSQQWKTFKDSDGQTRPAQDFSITSKIEIGNSKELSARIAEVNKQQLDAAENIMKWAPQDHDGSPLSLADAQLIQKSVQKHPELFELIERKIQESDNELFRVMALDVLNGRARVSKQKDVAELENEAKSTLNTAEDHYHDVARALDGVYDGHIWDEAPYIIKREFRSAEDATNYSNLYTTLRRQAEESEISITPHAVHMLSSSEMASHSPSLLVKIANRDDLSKIIRFNPDQTQLAEATKVWETASALPIELALEVKDSSPLQQVAADKAWRTTTQKTYDRNNVFDTNTGDFRAFHELNLLASEKDHQAFRAEWNKLKTQDAKTILSSDPEYLQSAAQHFFSDKFQQAQIDQLVNSLNSRLRREQDPTVLIRAFAESDPAVLSAIFNRLKDRTKPLSAYEATREYRELNAEAQAVTVTNIFGDRAGAYLDSLDANRIPIKDAIDRLHINSKEVNREFADWYFAHADKPIADRHRIAFMWNELTPEQRKLDFAKLEQTVLGIAVQRSKGVVGISEEGYAIMRELDFAKLHPEMDGPIRRAAILGMSGYTTATYAAEQALSAKMHGKSFEHALAKLGLPDSYRMSWSDLSRGRNPNEGGVFADTAKRAVVLSSLFGERLPNWYELQQANGRGALTASNIVPFAWTEGLTKPISIGRNGQQKEVQLSDLLFHNATRTMAEIANLVKGWEHFQANGKQSSVDLSKLSNVDQLTKEIQRNALKAGGESNFAITKSKLGEWSGYHRGSPNNEVVDLLPRSNPSEKQVRDAIQAADPEILLKVSRQFGDDATMLYDFARAAQILAHDKPIAIAELQTVSTGLQSAANEAGKMPALPGSQPAANEAGKMPALQGLQSAAIEAGKMPALPGSQPAVSDGGRIAQTGVAGASPAHRPGWGDLLDSPLPSNKAREFLFDVFDLQRRMGDIPSDPRAWNMYFNNKQLSAVDREIMIRNWNQLPEHLKAAPGRDAARYAFTSLSPKIAENVRVELAAKDLKEWERVAANNAWTAARSVKDFAFSPGKREVTYNDRAAEFWNKTYPEQLAKGQEQNYAQAGTAHIIHALYKHLNGQQRTALTAAYEAEFKKRGVLSRDTKLELIKDLKANSFFDNINSAGLILKDVPSNRLQHSVQENRQYAAALRLAQIFGPRSGEWLAARSKMHENFHDATEYLPFLSKRESAGLPEYLLRHSKHSAEEIRVVAAGWESLTPQERALPITEMVKTIRSRTYPDAKNPEFAIEAARWAVPESEYYQIEARFEASKSVPSPFPTEKIFAGESGLKGFFVRRDDPRGLFLGHHTNSCQHPHGDAASAAWYGQESPNSGFFVVTNSKNEIIAMSWAVISENKLLFDNVEAKGLGSRAEEVRQIYRSAARDLISTGKVDQVNLGTQHGDLPTRGMPTANANDMVTLPADYLAGDGYSDAATQVIIARN